MWVRVEVDTLNRCLKNTKPQAECKAVLRRIIVVNDSAVGQIWDENRYLTDNSYYNFDVAWRDKLLDYLPFDTDTSWAIATDYRLSGVGYIWVFHHEKGKTVFTKESFTQVYEYPDENDSLAGKEDVAVDMGLPHELSHQLLNLPDEYTQDLHIAGLSFGQYVMGNGSFSEPFLSPYLSSFMNDNVKKRARSPAYDGRLLIQSEDRPEKISLDLEFKDPDSDYAACQIRNVALVGGDFYRNKTVSAEADQVDLGKHIEFSSKLMEDNINCWIMDVVSNQGHRQLYLPASMFAVSKFAGVKDVSYTISFSGYDDPKAKTQEIKLVDGSDLAAFLNNLQNKGTLPYATMKADGTNTWFVWVLR
jgi:hypothetical protein